MSVQDFSLNCIQEKVCICTKYCTVLHCFDNTYIFICCEVRSHQVGMETRQSQDRPDGEETNNQFHNITRGLRFSTDIRYNVASLII